MRVIVIGGGIGGVSTAIALRRAGIDARVFERAPEPREVGAGIALGANAVMALRSIGAHTRVLAASDPITSLEVRAPSGRLITRSDIQAYERNLPDTSVLIHRADLLGALLSTAGPGVVTFGRACVSVEEQGTAVVAKFADGSVETGDVLIGADGIHSVVRSALFGDEPLRYSGYTCWRGVVSFGYEKVPRGAACEVWGRGSRFGYAHCGGGRIYWYATVNSSPGGKDEANPKPALNAYFGSWFDPIPEIIGQTLPTAVLRNDICDRPPVKRWGAGRMTLVGDAAHPTTPNVGQGGCMAIEDAVEIAEHLKGALNNGSGEVEAALRSYELARMPRTTMITNLSWRLGSMGQMETGLGRAVRDAAMWLLPGFSKKRQHLRIVDYRATVT